MRIVSLPLIITVNPHSITIARRIGAAVTLEMKAELHNHNGNSLSKESHHNHGDNHNRENNHVNGSNLSLVNHQERPVNGVKLNRNVHNGSSLNG